MRGDWLKKWYIPPTPKTDCYTCDANARNHNVRIDILKQCMNDYNSVIKYHERKTSVSSRTRSKSKSKSKSRSKTMRTRPRLILTRKKKDIVDRVDPITRRQTLVAMLAKKKISQERRKKSHDKNK